MTTTIQIRAIPNGKRTEVAGRYGEAWKVRVTAAPEKGRANEQLVRLLSEVLGVPRGAIEVVRGHGARDKVMAIQGIAPDLAEQRLTAAATSWRIWSGESRPGSLAVATDTDGPSVHLAAVGAVQQQGDA